MTLKRYSTQELIELCEDLFYDYMLEGKVFYAPKEVSSAINSRVYSKGIDCSNSNPCCMLYSQYLKYLNVCKDKLVDLHKTLDRVSVDRNYKEMIMGQIDFLNREYNTVAQLNKKLQKEIYEGSQDLKYSHSVITFPLNKLINSLYDDLWVEILFFDDICTPHGKLAELLSTPKNKQREYLKKNIEITHIGLVFQTRTPVIVVLKGTQGSNTGVRLNTFPAKFGDFQNLRLADMDSISSNDLRQLFQSKIDLDQENLQLLAEETIRGDKYWLYYDGKSKSHWLNSGYYIRYICSSTGRVYYNSLNLQNLAISKYFNKNDYSSYLRAWWNITHLGATIEGKPVISC